MKRTPATIVLVTLLLVTLACGIGSPITRRNNQIRRAALAYELSTFGPVDEVLVAYGLSEVRDNLGFEGGNTVWLDRFAEAKYFQQRDVNQSYLFLHDMSYKNNTATILIDRGDNEGIQRRKLTLRLEDNAWKVTSEESLEPSPSSTR